MTDLSGRRVLISGGSSGLGAALVARCAAAGARVGVLARRRDLLDALEAETGAVTAVCDVGDAAATSKAVGEIAERLGGLDAIVNAAGLMLHSRISAGQTDDWARMVQVNVLGTMHATNAALPFLRQAPLGDVLIVSSTSADRVTAPDFAMYAGTKAALLRIAEALRSDLADAENVRVTVVKPGYIRTDGLGPGIRDPAVRDATEAVKQRIGMAPDELATELCHLLALPAALNVQEMTIAPTARP